MIHDASQLADGALIEADLCVAGAGAAGITLALECARRGLSVCLLEGGEAERSEQSQRLYRGTSMPPLSDAYLYGSRLRQLGGTTNHWTGSCLTLDPIDFEVRDWVPHSGWPFTRDHLEPFYRRAAEVCRVQPGLELDEPLAEDALVGRKRVQSESLRFHEAYGPELAGLAELDTYLNANLIGIRLRPSGGSVDFLELAGYQGHRFRVRAGAYVLALGGIENCRLLLASDDVQPRGIGNDHDVLGRFFMDHPVLPIGEICVRGDDQAALVNLGRFEKHIFRLSDQAQRSNRLLNCCLAFFLVPRVEDIGRQLLTEGAWQRLASYLDDRGRIPESTAGGIAGTELYSRIFDFRPEHPPSPDSRLTLGPKTDRFGMRQVHLEWQFLGPSLETVEKTADILGRELGRLGLGRLRLLAGDQDRIYSPGFHHMGGTRMHEDPRQGVVDRHCRVHSVEDLFIAGSSVFPTCGSANPTFTIIALTLRLADHLVRRAERLR